MPSILAMVHRNYDMAFKANAAAVGGSRPLLLHWSSFLEEPEPVH